MLAVVGEAVRRDCVNAGRAALRQDGLGRFQIGGVREGTEGMWGIMAGCGEGSGGTQALRSLPAAIGSSGSVSRRARSSTIVDVSYRMSPEKDMPRASISEPSAASRKGASHRRG